MACCIAPPAHGVRPSPPDKPTADHRPALRHATTATGIPNCERQAPNRRRRRRRRAKPDRSLYRDHRNATAPGHLDRFPVPIPKHLRQTGSETGKPILHRQLCVEAASEYCNQCDHGDPKKLPVHLSSIDERPLGPVVTSLFQFCKMSLLRSTSTLGSQKREAPAQNDSDEASQVALMALACWP